MQIRHLALIVSIRSWESTSTPSVSKLFVCGIPFCCGFMPMKKVCYLDCMFVVVGQYLYFCGPAPIRRYVLPHLNFQMYSYGLISIQIPYLFLRLQCPCKLCFVAVGRWPSKLCVFMGIDTYPTCIRFYVCCRNSMLLWADAHEIFVLF